MKNNSIKIIAAALCAVLIGSGTVAGVFAADNGKAAESGSGTSLQADAVSESAAVQKDETVYVIAGADGSVQKLIVSDWLKNMLGSQTVNDASGLNGIENVKGDEGYSGSGNNIVWDAAGNDIYYQGSIEKELPVSMKISYQLDGKDISAADLAGKSGKVTIRFDYTNCQYQNVEIDGKQEKIYVPFAMLTGLLLDNDVFSEVSVSNGKLISDGDRTAVIGVAFPGLNENLKLDTEKFEIPSHVEITASVKNFKLGNTVTVAANGIFNEIDSGAFEKADELTSQMDQLTDAMRQLTDGSSVLYDGICTLLDKSSALVSGINQLAEGVQTLKAGSSELAAGAASVASGASELSAALHTIAGNNDKLSGGAKAVFDTLLATADSQLAASGITGIPALTIENYKQVLSGVILSLSESNIRAQADKTALNSVTAQVNANRAKVEAGVTAAVRAKAQPQVEAAARETVLGQVLATMNMTPDAYSAAVSAGMISAEQQAAVTAAVDAQMQSEAVLAIISAKTDEQMASAPIKAMILQNTENQIALLIEENMKSDAVTSQIEAAVAQAKEGVKSITALIAQLDSYHEFYNGIKEYTADVSAAAQGSDSLKNGAAELYSGAVTLDHGVASLLDGIITLKNDVPALISGIEQLKDGSMELHNGIVKLDQDGISKLTDAVNGDLAGLLTRFRATVDVSKDYTSFSGITDDADGSVKFIYHTESVG